MPIARSFPNSVGSYPEVGSYAIPEVDINYGRFAAVDNTAIVVRLLLYDLNRIKAQLIAHSPSTSWLAVDQCALRDQNGQSVIPLVNGINTQQTTNYTEDRTHPRLLNFTLNMNTGLLAMFFSETVNLATLIPTQLTLQSTANASTNSSESYTLVYTSTLGSGYATSLALQINTLDLDQIKFLRALATNIDSTYLSITSMAIEDTETNSVTSISVYNALKASNYTRDSTRPNLLSFNLNMNSAVFTLTFDETVSADTFIPTSLVLQNDIYVPTMNYRLTGGHFPSVDSTVITLNISEYDLNEIKKVRNIATDRYTTNIFFDSSLVRDTDGNSVNPTTQAVTVYTPDRTPPYLRYFAVNLTSETIRFVFSEIIDAYTFDSVRLTLQEASIPFRQITLTATSVLIQPEDSTELVLLIETSALNYIKIYRDFFTNLDNSFISFTSYLAKDMNGNNIVSADGIRASYFFGDYVRPELNFFSLDLTREALVLTFSETVDYATLWISELTLQQVKDHVGSSVEDWTLTGGDISPVYSTILTIKLTEYDLNNIKRIVELATSSSSTYLRLTWKFIRDMTNNSIVAIPENEGLRVTQFTGDTIRPYLVSYTLDLTQNFVNLSFSETVSQPSFQVRYLTLQSTGTSDFYFITLSSYANISEVNATFLTFYFEYNDLNTLNAITQVGTSPNDTFLSHSSTLISDMSGNTIAPIPYSRALQVEYFIPDSVSPSLLSFDFDLNQGTIRLSFSETLNAVPTNLTSLVFQSFSNLTFASQMGINVTRLRLTIGNVSYIPLDPPRVIASCHFSPSDKLLIKFSTNDLNSFKSDSNLCESKTDCFLTFDTNAFVDSAGNKVIPIPIDQALPTTQFLSDISSPLLIQFVSINMSLGQITLQFNEPISRNTPSMLPLNSVRLLRFYRLIDISHPLESLLLDPGTVAIGQTQHFVTITLTTDNLNELKKNDLLCTSIYDCWLSLQRGTFFDPQFNGNIQVGIDNALNVFNFYPDTSPPTLISFDLGIDSGNLSLTFDEVIRPSTFSPNLLYLVNSQITPSIRYNLTSGSNTISALNDLVLYIRLSQLDITAIKNLTSLATEQNNTFLQLLYGALSDTSGNPILGTPIIRASNFEEDSIPPRILEFSLNLVTDSLSFTFSEIVLSSSFNLQSFSLIPGPDLPGVTLTLKSFSGYFGAFVISVELSDDDILQLKLDPTLATYTFNTYLTAAANTVRDMQGNYLVPILSSDPLRASSVVADTKPPSLLYFTFDLNLGHIVLTFDDVVVSSSLRGSSLVLQNGYTRSVYHRLSDSSYTSSPNGYYITLVIVLTDLNAIKANPLLATNINNTYVTIGAGLIRDQNNLDVLPISNDNGLRASIFYRDKTAPELDGFSFDLDSGYLTLSFSETVQGQTLRETALTLRSSSISASTSYTLQSSLSISDSSPEVVVVLSPYDLNRVKLTTDLFTNESNSFLSMSNNSIQDVSGNYALSIPANRALSINQFIPDTTDPILLTYDLDINTGVVNLTFSEAVNLSSFVASGLTLQNTEDTIFPRVTFNDDVRILLSGFLSTFFEFEIDTDDLNRIKYFANLATRVDNTYLVIKPETLTDMSGNQVVAVYNPFAIQASNFRPDSTSPVFITYSLNLNLSIPLITLVFDETLDSSTLDVSQVIIQSTREPYCNYTTASNNSNCPIAHAFSPGPLPLYTLTESDNSTVVVVQIGEVDSNRIKYLSQLATSLASAVVHINRYAIRDMNWNPFNPILNISPAGNFYPDEIPPTLRRFSLDMDKRIISLTFDETVNVDSTIPSLILLQNRDFSTVSLLLISSYLTPGQDNSTIVNISISNQDFNSITADTLFATSIENSYIRLLYNAIRDMNANPVQDIMNGNALPPYLYIPDTSRPSLVSFSIDMNSLRMGLTFTETMNASSLDISTISLHQLSSIGGEYFTFTLNSLTTSLYSTVVNIEIGREDANEIKRLSLLAQSQNSTYLSITYKTIEDMNTNQVFPNYIIANSYIPDSSPPVILQFLLDLTGESIALSFDETVRVSSIDATRITIQSSDILSSPSLVLYTLRHPLQVLTSYDSTFLTAVIDVRDINQLKLYLDLATNPSNTFIAFQMDAIVDMALIPNSIVAGTILQSGSVLPDLTPPNLIAFETDMNSGTLTLNFDEPINVTSIYIPALTVQSAARSRTGLQLYNSSLLTPSNGLSILIRFSESELNEIKRIDSLFTNPYDSYVSITNQFITDLNRNPVVALLNGFALRASRFSPDVNRPSIVAYSINMNIGYISLLFSETVNVSSFRCSDISISEIPYCNNSYQLSGCLIDTSGAVYDSQDIGNAGSQPGGYGNATKWNTTYLYSTALKFYFTLFDLNNLKILRIAVDQSSAYLHFKSSTIIDQRNLLVLEINCSSPGLLPLSGFSPDNTRPSLESFSFSLASGLLALNFSETVYGSRLDETQLTFVGLQDNSSSSFQYYTLTQVSNTNGLSPYLTVYVSTFDLNRIKERIHLATDTSNTFITITDTFITDTLSNPVNSIGVSTALQAAAFSPDTIDVKLLSYDFDMNTGTFTFTFDETVNASSLIPSELWLQAHSNVTFPSYQIISGNQSTSYSTVVSLTVSEYDLNSIKNLTILATSVADTYIYFSYRFISDMNYNGIVPVLLTNASQVNSFTADDTKPELIRFSVDLTTKMISLTFSEVVNSSSFYARAISLRSHLAPGIYYTLTGGERQTYFNSLVVDFRLLVIDLNFIKVDTGLFTSVNNSFISIESSLIRDMNANPIVANSVGLQASELYGDFIRPNLVSFDLNLNTHFLTLNFDETVNVASLSIGEITIQSHNDSGEIWTLSGGSPPIYSSLYLDTNSTVVFIRLGLIDQANLKINIYLAVSKGTTYLYHSSNLIRDMNSNYVEPTLSTNALEVSQFTSDLTPPELRHFDLNLDTEVLTLEFSEVVNASSLNCQGLSLSNAAVFPTSTLSLYNCTSRPGNGYILYVDLGLYFLNEIKLATNLATSASNTYIYFPESVVTDMNDNFVIAITVNNTQQVRNFTEDMTSPSLLRFDLDMDAGSVRLYFSESMNSNLVDPTQVILSSSRFLSNTDSIYQLTSGTVQTDNSPIINFNITKYDLDRIKLYRNLATSTLNTYILFNINSTINPFAVDMNFNKVLPITNGSGLPVSTFTADTTPPDIISITLDLNSPQLTVTFTEPIDSFTIQINNGNVNFFNYSINIFSPPQYTLINGYSNSYDGLAISINISIQDFNQLNFIRTVGFDKYSTFLYFPDLVRDMNGNLITTLFNGDNDTRPIDSFIPDGNNPWVVSFDLDMNYGFLDITFNEVVTDILPIYYALLNNLNQSYNLLTSTIVSGPAIDGPGHPPEITILISTRDLNEIKALRNLATSNITTFLSVTSLAASDIAGNPILSTVSYPTPVRQYTPDQTRHQLVSFTFDLDNGFLALTFDESISVSTTRYTEISFLSSAQAPVASYTLQFPTDSTISSDGTTKLYVDISENDLNEIKILPTLLTEMSNSFISLTETFLLDTSSNLLNTSNLPLPISLLDLDITRPTLTSFDLDMNTNILSLYFSESVNVSSLNISQITLQTYYTFVNQTMEKYTLQSAYTPSVDGPTVIIILGNTDVNEIKKLTRIATRSSNTYITITAQTISDMSTLQVNPILDGSAQPVGIFVADATPPSMVGFQFDFNIGFLSLTFDETIDISSFAPSKVTFYNSMHTYTLQLGDLFNVTEDSTSFTFFLRKFDIDNLKLRSTLLYVNATTNLQLETGTVVDLSDARLGSFTVLRTNISFVPDRTSPQLIA